MDIAIKRAYEAAGQSDGSRVLVDRLWPRGVSKAKADLAEWAKDIAPSDELRAWYGHDPAKWAEFRRRYFAELSEKPEAVDALRAMAREGRLTLVYASREEKLNNAAALRDYLNGERE
ncbi:MAG: DUF488 family protein [Paracoccus sp. (in: a-proteobacteria)]|nr:DUF488 family protein [Paracoccus sp. (in: a-proteobacteria)]